MRTHPHIPRATVATVVAALALAACSGGDDAGTAASTEASSGVTAPVTSPATEPTAAPSSTSTTTTSTTSTTAAPTTTAPSTTTEPPTSTTPTSSTLPVEISDPGDPEIQAMFKAVEANFAAFDLAMQQPENAEREQSVLATTTGEMTDNVTATLARLREDGRVQVPNPTEPDRVQIVPELAFISGEFGSVEACIISPSVLVDVGTEPTDDTFGDAVQSFSASYNMTKVGDTWLVSSLQIFNQYEGQIGCD